MFKKLFTISILLALLATMIYAQDGRYILRPNGEKIQLNSDLDLRDAIKVSKFKNFDGVVAKNNFLDIKFNYAGILDTLAYSDQGTFETPFLFYGQDIMMEYFEAPADMKIKAAGFSFEGDVEGVTVGVRLVKLNMTFAELQAFGTKYVGNYPDPDDGQGGIDFFGEETDSAWVDKTGGSFVTPPWGHDDYDLWSDGTYAWPVDPVEAASAGNFQWLEMTSLGFEPEVKQGDVIGVVLINNSTEGTAADFTIWASADRGVRGWKYYENGRLSLADGGWWIRTYTWDMALAVDLTGDRAPVISTLTKISTSENTGPFTVEATIIDDNPGGGAFGVEVANLQYSIDKKATWTDVAMTATGDVYSAEIPAQSGGTTVYYKVYAEDVAGFSSVRDGGSFYVFVPASENLVIFNGFSAVSGYPQSYYFGIDAGGGAFQVWSRDVWAYGAFPASIISNYKNIVEITINNSGPSDNNLEAITAWLAGDATRNYMLIGDEFLGVHSGWTDSTYSAGSFQYDVLGIASDHNDINYDGSAASVAAASIVMPVQGTLLGGKLFDLYTENAAASAGDDTMFYDPRYELGSAGANFLDGVDLVDGEVDIKGIGLDGNEYNIGYHRTLTAGNKVVFLAYDALSLNSSPYYWYGDSRTAPQVLALEWFGISGIVTGVSDDNLSPDQFYLAQNYPNPFNPATKISFSIAERSNVTLKVINLLGQEVATLFNGVKFAGVHEVSFNASNLASGVYFYTLSAGDFVSTKKMMLIK
ncbi:MAG: T9SS type A sorting domain-containing protein [Bacteroidota bacterium]